MNTWYVFALGSAFFAALTAIFGKIGVEGVNSNFATFIRTLVILVVTAIILSLQNQWQRFESVSQRTYVFLILSGIATGFSWLCYYRALQLGEASKVAPVDKLSVALVIIFAVLFLGETLTFKAAAGAALIVAGSLVLVL